jgi:hypothetical protein
MLTKSITGIIADAVHAGRSSSFPELEGRIFQTGGGIEKANGIPTENDGENGDQPLSGMFQKRIVPIAFSLSGGALLCCCIFGLGAWLLRSLLRSLLAGCPRLFGVACCDGGTKANPPLQSRSGAQPRVVVLSCLNRNFENVLGKPISAISETSRGRR